LLPKDRYHRFGDVIDAPEVGLELGAEVLVVGGLDRRDVGVADVINDDVQAAEVAAGVRDRRTRGLGAGDVQADRLDALAVLGDEVASVTGGSDEGTA